MKINLYQIILIYKNICLQFFTRYIIFIDRWWIAIIVHRVSKLLTDCSLQFPVTQVKSKHNLSISIASIALIQVQSPSNDVRYHVPIIMEPKYIEFTYFTLFSLLLLIMVVHLQAFFGKGEFIRFSDFFKFLKFPLYIKKIINKQNSMHSDILLC